jgi:hypothetical protein
MLGKVLDLLSSGISKQQPFFSPPILLAKYGRNMGI